MKGVILIVDDTPANLDLMVAALTDEGFEVAVAVDGESALEQLNHGLPDLILLDVLMPGLDGFETCRQLKTQPNTQDIPVIFMTALTDTEDKVKAFQAGAVDYVTKPLQYDEVLARIRTHLTLRNLQQNLEQTVSERTRELQNAFKEVAALKRQLETENVYLKEEIKNTHNFDTLIGKSPAIQTVLQKIEQVAPTDATVLITGETGTGKELIARAIHNLSPRQDRPLIKVDCATLPKDLIENELFGHEKGAFTGAQERRMGRFEMADGATIFLDEIGDLPLELQTKLLRVLQDGSFNRLGSSHPIHVNARIIAATNHDLNQAITNGTFRQDLYYRLNVFPIHSPPLHQRVEDIPLMADHFLKKYATKIGKHIHSISPTAVKTLQDYPWPGNVRELEHVIERATIICTETELTPGDWLPQQNTHHQNTSITTLETLERTHILRVLELTHWRIRGTGGAAKILGLNPTTLESRMKKLNIQRTSFHNS